MVTHKHITFLISSLSICCMYHRAFRLALCYVRYTVNGFMLKLIWPPLAELKWILRQPGFTQTAAYSNMVAAGNWVGCESWQLFHWYPCCCDYTLGNQNAQLLSERPIHEKRNVQLTTFWSKWRKKQSGVFVWCWITNIYWGIYGDNHAHGTRKHFGKGLVTGRQDSRHTVFLVVCTANATS